MTELRCRVFFLSGAVAEHLKQQTGARLGAVPAPALLRYAANAVEAQSVPVRWLLVALLTGLVAAGDVLTGPQVAFSIFYLLPVTLAAWHLGWLPALLTVGVSGTVWLVADRITGNEYDVQAVQYWNALVRTGFFFIVAYTLTRLRQGLEHERELARTDGLTGVANSRSFRELAERELARSRRQKTPLTVAYIDVDGFKSVNDTLGHAAGDDLLRAIAGELAAEIRDVDLAARVGGDEFALLLPGLGADAAPAAIDRLLARLGVQVAGGRGLVGFSIGVVTAEREDVTLDEVIGRADVLMYEAKRAGGHRAQFGTLVNRDSTPG